MRILWKQNKKQLIISLSVLFTVILFNYLSSRYSIVGQFKGFMIASWPYFALALIIYLYKNHNKNSYKSRLEKLVDKSNKK